MGVEAGGDEWEDADQFGDGLLQLLHGFDPGVMGAVAALVAAGCSPVSSCNGLPEHWSDRPTISFWCPRKAFPQIRRAAEFTGVCLESAGGVEGEGIRASHPTDWRVIRE